MSSPSFARAGWLAAFAAFAWSRGALAADTDSSARPPALEGRTGCELWVGKVSGNDPSVLVEALLCEGMNGSVTGQLQWSSLESGYSIRDVEGIWRDRDKLSLHDSRLTVSKPNQGWVFCMVDAYDLVRTGDQLNGSYTSRKCHDRATVTLTKRASPVVVPTPAEAASSVPEVEASARAPEPRPTPSACACEVGRHRPPDTTAPLTALALSLAWRRRARSRAARPRASA